METLRVNKKAVKIVAMFLVSILFAFSVIECIGKTSQVYASKISDLEDEIAKLEQKNKELNSNMNNVKGKIRDEQGKQQALQTQIKNTEQQIVLYNQKLDVVRKNIGDKTEEIKLKEEDIFKNQELFAQRVRAMYISGSNSMLSVVLSADNFSEFLTRTEVLKRISQSDQKLIDTLSKQKEDLAKIKTDMEKQNQELASTKQKLTITSKSLEGLKAQSNKQEADLKKKYDEDYANRQANKKKIAAQEAEINRIIAASQGNTTLPPGQYQWPVPSSSRITSPFGMRTWGSQQEFHYGIDIGAPAGTNIVAANPGKVIMVKKQNYGYGWYLVIDHGGGHATLYAHTSRIDVNVGDTVKRGDVIAGVGTTGNSTGNHLHFEVRVNGKRYNPLNYVRKQS